MIQTYVDTSGPAPVLRKREVQPYVDVSGPSPVVKYRFIKDLGIVTPDIQGPFFYAPQPAATGVVTRSLAPRQPSESNVSPAGGVVPLLYGRRQVQGLFIYLKVISNVLHAIYLLLEGDIDAIEEVDLNGKEYSTYGSAVHCEQYLGTQGQTVCSLSNYDATWTDPLTGIAYLYIRLSRSDVIQDLPEVKAICRGRKVYDPRNGTTAYSTNPALHLADLLVSLTYGGRVDSSLIDWDSVTAAANYCDELVGDAPDEQKRFEFNYLFTGGKLKDVVPTICRHFLGAVLFDEGKFRLDYAHARTAGEGFVEKEIWGLKILAVQSQDLLNVVTWNWTDPTSWESVDDSIEDPDLGANDEVHEGNYDLTGCLTLSQSKRLATYFLNSRILDLTIQFNTFNNKGVQPGDVFPVTHSLGLDAKQMQATAVEPQQDGSSVITAREYDPASYSDEVVTEPTFPDTDLPKPTDVPDDASNMVLEEKLRQLKDGTWISIIEISWAASPWPFPLTYEVWAKEDDGEFTLMWTTIGTQSQLPAVKELAKYTVKIVAVSTWQMKSSGIEKDIIPQGKYLKPVWKTGAALSAVEAQDVVHLRWYMADGTRPAEDIDIAGYQIRRGRTTDTWETASIVNACVDTLEYQDKTCPAGTWRFFLKALDSVGNDTITALSSDVSVTLNPYLSLQQEHYLDLAEASVTDAAISDIDGEEQAYPVPGLTWGQRFDLAKAWNDAAQTYPLSSYPVWITPNLVGGTQIVDCGYIDLGNAVSGQFSVQYVTLKIGTGAATLTPYLRFAQSQAAGSGLKATPDGAFPEGFSPFTAGPIWGSWQDASNVITAKARFIGLKFEFSSPDDKSFYVLQGDPYIHLQAQPKKEPFTVSVDASGRLTIAFINTFTFINRVSLTPKFMNDGGDPRQPNYDNLSLTGMDVVLFDKTNALASGEVMGEIEGY